MLITDTYLRDLLAYILMKDLRGKWMGLTPGRIPTLVTTLTLLRPSGSLMRTNGLRLQDSAISASKSSSTSSTDCCATLLRNREPVLSCLILRGVMNICPQGHSKTVVPLALGCLLPPSVENIWRLLHDWRAPVDSACCWICGWSMCLHKRQSLRIWSGGKEEDTWRLSFVLKMRLVYKSILLLNSGGYNIMP